MFVCVCVWVVFYLKCVHANFIGAADLGITVVLSMSPATTPATFKYV